MRHLNLNVSNVNDSNVSNTPNDAKIVLNSSDFPFLNENKEFILLHFKDSTELANTIDVLLKTIRLASYFSELDKSQDDKFCPIETALALKLVQQLIPYQTLEFYDSIKTDFINLKSNCHE